MLHDENVEVKWDVNKGGQHEHHEGFAEIGCKSLPWK